MHSVVVKKNPAGICLSRHGTAPLFQAGFSTTYTPPPLMHGSDSSRWEAKIKRGNLLSSSLKELQNHGCQLAFLKAKSAQFGLF